MVPAIFDSRIVITIASSIVKSFARLPTESIQSELSGSWYATSELIAGKVASKGPSDFALNSVVLSVVLTGRTARTLGQSEWIAKIDRAIRYIYVKIQRGPEQTQVLSYR